MQPTLVITAPIEGMVSINGRFTGEIRPDVPLLTPVSPFGPVWLEFHPLAAGYLPLARKIVFSGGIPLADSAEKDVFLTLWPGNISEIELSPEPLPDFRMETCTPSGVPCRIFRGRNALLEIGSTYVPLPRDAEITCLHRTGDAAALTGTADGGQFLIALSADLSRQTGFLSADSIDPESPGIFRAMEFFSDTAGRGKLERWRLDASGLTLVSSGMIWENGVPNSPATPEAAALAAVEAALLKRMDEAESYFMPGMELPSLLENIPELGALCLPMKYGQPASPAVALLQPESENFARVIPMYYRAAQLGNEWRLTDLYI